MTKDLPMTLVELLTRKVAAEPDLTILTVVEVNPDGSFSDERRTYAELMRNAASLAVTLRGLGVGEGSHFAIMMRNHPEFVEAMIAGIMLGAVFVPIDPRTMGSKLDYVLRFSECTGVIGTADCLEAVAGLPDALPDLRWMVHVAGAPAIGAGGQRLLCFADAIANDGDIAPIAADPHDPMFMMFTSGTTGNPKGVVMSHAQYMAYARGRGFGAGPDDRCYTGLSLTHINAQGTLRSGLAHSVPVVMSRKFTKSRLWDICRAYGCTTFTLLGGMIPEIFSVPPKPDDADNPVRLIISSGMPRDLWNRYRERFGVEICEGYGSTEGGGALVNPPGEGPAGSIGRPFGATEAAVFDEAGRRCGPNEPGELRFRQQDGKAPRVSYYKNAEASQAKVRDGWFHSGDIVHYDEDGWFFFHHRVGGGVRRNGDFVNTALVESVISQSPLVDDVFVYGVETPGKVAGEKMLVAAVVAARDADYSEAALLAHCRAHLERNDVPELFQLLDAIPKTISEKPIERACIDLLGERGLLPA
ncbi:MAG: AMP-binding protein [Sphingobium sp.]